MEAALNNNNGEAEKKNVEIEVKVNGDSGCEENVGDAGGSKAKEEIIKSRYEFINCNDTEDEVFVHQKAIMKNNPKKVVRSVGGGKIVELDSVGSEKGNEAYNARGPDSALVKGSPYAADRHPGVAFGSSLMTKTDSVTVSATESVLNNNGKVEEKKVEKMETKVNSDSRCEENVKGAGGSKANEEPKEIIAHKVTGTVKWFNVKGGYGFIKRNDTGEEVFVHQTGIMKNNPMKAVRSVGDGEIVKFDVAVGEKGNEACNVSGPQGAPVKGSPYAADRRSKGKAKTAAEVRD